MDELIERMGEQVANGSVTRELRIPQSEGELIARLHRQAKVLEMEYLDNEVRLVAVLPMRLAETCSEWFADERSEKPADAPHSLETN
jgi:GTP-binding protein HflX